MIVTCDGCRTKYLLSDEKVPERGIRVRCPKCKYVWRLMPPADSSIFEVASGAFAGGEEPMIGDRQEAGWTALEKSLRTLAGRIAQPAAEESPIEERHEEPAAAAATEDPELRKRLDRSKRLARVFVSDILVYNKEKRDKALANGDLMTVFGPEIKKAWEAYKDKIGSDLPESSQYFRDALNEILADGRKIF
jgi:predicted Zn finger-like uncharacterized protein